MGFMPALRKSGIPTLPMDQGRRPGRENSRPPKRDIISRFQTGIPGRQGTAVPASHSQTAGLLCSSPMPPRTPSAGSRNGKRPELKINFFFFYAVVRSIGSCTRIPESADRPAINGGPRREPDLVPAFLLNGALQPRKAQSDHAAANSSTRMGRRIQHDPFPVLGLLAMIREDGRTISIPSGRRLVPAPARRRIPTGLLVRFRPARRFLQRKNRDTESGVHAAKLNPCQDCPRLPGTRQSRAVIN